MPQVDSQRITMLRARGFRSLEDVTVPLGPLSVLVGPNGSGKSNVLNVLRFLATTVRFDLGVAVAQWGGWERVLRQGGGPSQEVELGLEGLVTQHAKETSLDKYTLNLRSEEGGLERSETFEFKRYRGAGRKITVQGTKVEISGDRRSSSHLASPQSTGLATLPKLGDQEGGEGIRTFAEFLASIRVLEPDVGAAREPSRVVGAGLAGDASNLADALLTLRMRDEQAFLDVQRDLAAILPGLDQIELGSLGGSTASAVVRLVERGVSRPVDLADASFGTVRSLALLVALHDPSPPSLTAIEEIDHGIHPYGLDVLVDRLRSAAERTQLLVTTHSPTLVNRLKVGELVMCGRDADTGASRIPALRRDELQEAVGGGDLRLGELWFAGVIDGIPA